MSNIPLLTFITFLPLAGVAMILLMVQGDVKDDSKRAKLIALWTSLATFLLSLALWFGFDTSTAEFQFVEKVEWLPSIGVNYHMGIDGISMLFVLLSTLLTPICILSAWDAVTKRAKEYMISFLILETMMIGMFCALDMMLFYIFFEGVLIPMFIIIGVWGGQNRIYAAFKLFLYTLLGSVLMLVAMLAMYWDANSFDIPTLMNHNFPAQMQTWIWLAFFASFAVKVPMWPVHTWLPDAHVQAPTAGSVILAGVLLKMGGYGFLRFSIPMMPIASADFTPLIYTLSIVAVIYTSLVALVQDDMKKLIAYSSIAHMGFVTIGAFTGTVQGVEGSIFTMLSHGIVSAALFLIVGVIYDRIHTREIAAYGGLVDRMPKYAVVFMLFMMASVGLPGTSGFVGEILVLVGVFQVDQWVAALAATGAILGAAYSLYLYRRIVFGALTKDSLKAILDMNRREVLVFAPLIFLTLFAGVYPQPFLDVMHASVENLVNNYHAALDAAGVKVAAQ
ncbi:NADH-quinone oxidoreductase subunit M [Terasakiella sp. A23]|uniref:NADH-quinone oxidoreductase subunit M n=1 Tax=Terasakiella sp. FCG-A23 TaxID=3080561 RepID=UPI002953CF53|nr:NADH-quinone oxidoreductase subunit M [Terasakiella sp. A23]MDV7338841.1 NADH-quinone oxidoreductase subunit M [Terasakiella sp. A23]